MMYLNYKTIAVDISDGRVARDEAAISKAARGLISAVKPVWCPGCGDYRFLDALRNVLAELGIIRDELVVVSGIGCSGRSSHYFDAYGFHGVHGGAIPAALGVHVANENLTTLVIGGDGDLLAIGGGFLPHAAKKRAKLTVIMLNNGIYGLTKGQAAPTTRLMKTKTTPHGQTETALNPVQLALAYRASFVARVFAGNKDQKKQVFNVLLAAIQHQGFAFIDWLSVCSTFNTEDVPDQIARARSIPADHDTTDQAAANALAEAHEGTSLGIFYQVQRETYIECQNRLAQKAQAQAGGIVTLDSLFDPFA